MSSPLCTGESGGAVASQLRKTSLVVHLGAPQAVSGLHDEAGFRCA